MIIKNANRTPPPPLSYQHDTVVCQKPITLINCLSTFQKSLFLTFFQLSRTRFLMIIFHRLERFFFSAGKVFEKFNFKGLEKLWGEKTLGLRYFSEAPGGRKLNIKDRCIFLIKYCTVHKILNLIVYGVYN